MNDDDGMAMSDVLILRLSPIDDPAIPRLVQSIIRTLREVEAQHRRARRDDRREVTLWTKGKQ